MASTTRIVSHSTVSLIISCVVRSARVFPDNLRRVFGPPLSRLVSVLVSPRQRLRRFPFPPDTCPNRLDSDSISFRSGPFQRFKNNTRRGNAALDALFSRLGLGFFCGFASRCRLLPPAHGGWRCNAAETVEHALGAHRGWYTCAGLFNKFRVFSILPFCFRVPDKLPVNRRRQLATGGLPAGTGARTPFGRSPVRGPLPSRICTRRNDKNKNTHTYTYLY